MLGQSSDRVMVETVGQSTLGRPFLVIWVSSPANLAQLGRWYEEGKIKPHVCATYPLEQVDQALIAMHCGEMFP